MVYQIKKEHLGNKRYKTRLVKKASRDFMRRIRPCEVKEALHRMKTRKTVVSDEIPIEV